MEYGALCNSARCSSLRRPHAQERIQAALPAPTLPEPGRSRRSRFRPLEYWRGERIMYGRRESTRFEAIVDVQIAEREPTPPHFRRKREREAV